MTERLHFHFSLSCIGEGNGNPLQCSCLENPRDGGAWWAAVYRVAQSRTRLKRLSSSRHIFRAVGETDLWWQWSVHLEKPLQKALLLTNNSVSPLYIVLSFCGQGNFSSSESHSVEGTRRFNLCLKKIPEMFLQVEATQGHLSDTA